MPLARGKRGLNSGKVQTMDSIVTKKVVWPHKLVLNTHGQPSVYGDMSLALFVNGYLTVFAEEDKDIKHCSPSTPLGVNGGRGDLRLEGSPGLSRCLVEEH